MGFIGRIIADACSRFGREAVRAFDEILNLRENCAIFREMLLQMDENYTAASGRCFFEITGTGRGKMRK